LTDRRLSRDRGSPDRGKAVIPEPRGFRCGVRDSIAVALSGPRNGSHGEFQESLQGEL